MERRTEVQEIIGALKKGGTPSMQETEKLLGYLESERQMDAVFAALYEEDAIGRVYCMMLLQKGIQKVQSRSIEELDRYIQKIEQVMDTVAQSREGVEKNKMGAVYATLAVLYWPVKVERFVERAFGLVRAKNKLGMEVVRNFLAQVADSLEITEKRRYELKKNIKPIASELVQAIAESFGMKEVTEVLTWMCRIKIAREEVLSRYFAQQTEFTVEVGVLVREVSVDTNTALFETIGAYLSQHYSAAKQREREAAGMVLECAAVYGAQSGPKTMQAGTYDVLLREAIYDSVHDMKDAIDREVVLSVLKTYTMRAKGYISHRNKGAGTHTEGNSVQSEGRREEEVRVVLGSNPALFLASLCNLAVCVGVESNDAIVRALDVIGGHFAHLCTEFLAQYSESIPVSASEALLKHAVCRIAFTSPYLLVKQSVLRREYDEEAIRRVDIRTGKECNTVKECLEEMYKEKRASAELIMDVYRRAMEIGGYYSLDLAVTCGVLLERKDLIMQTMQGFEGKGIAAFVAAISRCPEVIKDMFEQFQQYFVQKEDDLAGCISAIVKILEHNSAAQKTKNKDGAVKVCIAHVDAVEMLGRPVTEKIYNRVETGTLQEVKKIVKLLPYLLGDVHSAFVHKLWSRAKREIEYEAYTRNYTHNGDVQTVVQHIAVECSANEVGVLCDIVESEECTARSTLTGIRKVLDTCAESRYSAEVQRTAVRMLVAMYVTHTEESTRTQIVGMLSESAERVMLMESMYEIDLSEVHSAKEKEKRVVMKKALRRIEGMKEKQGALLHKVRKSTEDDRWADMAPLF